jgi:hypothetical protein
MCDSGTNDTKKVYYKLSRPDLFGDYCVFPNFDSIFFELDGSEVGTKFEIEIVEMTEEEFEDLGEFEGW